MRTSEPLIPGFQSPASVSKLARGEYPSVTVRLRQHHVWWTDADGRPRVQGHDDVLAAIAHVEALRSAGLVDAVIDVESGDWARRVAEWERAHAR